MKQRCLSITKLCCLLFVILAIGCRPHAEDRTFWKHKNGHFQKMDGDVWTEQSPDGPHSFREISRMKDHVTLLDKSRGITIELHGDHAEVGATNFWNDRLYLGYWSTAEAEATAK